MDAAGDGEIATRPADPDPVVAPGGPSVAVLQVRGLSCPLCAHNVDSQLRRLPGVTSAEIDLESGLVTVQLLRGKAPTPATLRHSVEEAGFTVDRVDLR